ncbi:hypothetical protein HID58_073898 [Brassica napus]|uniref:Uncharacterized protein n=1 Tax=Brassica napus TaxID=3708 RepID=A0ABQ7YI59_BRANA|nr:hypothetical protein HID58_073898 [Brassica napus]
MEVVSSSTYLQAGLEKGDNCVMVCLCWKVTMILSVSFYRVSVILYLFHLLFVSLASLCSCSHLSFLVHQKRLVWGIKLCVSVLVEKGGKMLWELIPQLATSRGSATIIVAMLEEVCSENRQYTRLFQCSAFEKEILIRFHSAGQIIFSTTPQEHYFDCPIHLMLPLHGGGGGSNMTKKIFVGN